MDWAQWIAMSVSALCGSAATFGGVWFWFRRNQLKLRREEAEDRASIDATASKSWRELMDYKSDDYRKKNTEQDARAAAMQLKMDEMHANHLKCERDAAEREIAYKREAANREIKLMQHEARIAELSEQIVILRQDIESLRKNADKSS